MVKTIVAFVLCIVIASALGCAINSHRVRHKPALEVYAWIAALVAIFAVGVFL